MSEPLKTSRIWFKMTDIVSSKRSLLSYLKWSFIITGLGLFLGGWLGWLTAGTFQGAVKIFFVCAVLAVLEISLSFDNAIVNANKLKEMTPKWQRRFLTWGILIAVFGMRIIFPLLIVVIAANVSPVDALIMAIFHPDKYADIMIDAHLPIVAFGGTFLMMVALKYFFDPAKDVHWWGWGEEKLASLAKIRGLEVGFVLLVVLLFTMFLPSDEKQTFLICCLYGLVSYIGVEVLGALLDRSNEATNVAVKGGLGAFLYLEVLDSSFSFDGVIGAFALTNNLFVIAIGLGIGAMYVRSMTIMLVENGTLTRYRYLEHGAFYAVLALSIVMFAQTMIHVPEVITGLCGAGLIGVSLWASIRWNNNSSRAKDTDPHH